MLHPSFLGPKHCPTALLCLHLHLCVSTVLTLRQGIDVTKAEPAEGEYSNLEKSRGQKHKAWDKEEQGCSHLGCSSLEV